MAATYSFHPEALFEYAEAANYYLGEASVRVADSFVAAIESAVTALVVAPTRWRVIEEPEIRRYVLSRFPFVIYYRGNSNMSVWSSMPSCIAAVIPAIGVIALNETDRLARQQS